MIYKKFDNKICKDEMSYDDCELALLRNAIDKTENIKTKISNSEEIQKMIYIVEEYIIKNKLICYGGTAINNLLPKKEQFYNRDVEIPDYDVYSTDALTDAKTLADIFYKKGYSEVESKSGVHYGTFKIFVNFIPMIDLTMIPKDLYNNLLTDAIIIDKVYYAPPNFLRMSIYLELSRPKGDVSRWEKIFKRLVLLNKYYPIMEKDGSLVNKCNHIQTQRHMSTNKKNEKRIFYIMRDSFINDNVIFFGGYSMSLYKKYSYKNIIKNFPDFDVLSIDIDKTSYNVCMSLVNAGFENLKVIKHKEIGDIIPEHNEIIIKNETVAFIYKPMSCHSYNKIKIDNNIIYVATIDTILSFYLAFYYINKPYFNKDRLLCLAEFLFEIEEKNRLGQKGLLKRFSISCYGKQETLNDIRSNKTRLYEKYKNNKNSKEYEMYFLKYNPANYIKTNIKKIPIKGLEKNKKNNFFKKTIKNLIFIDETKTDNIKNNQSINKKKIKNNNNKSKKIRIKKNKT